MRWDPVEPGSPPKKPGSVEAVVDEMISREWVRAFVLNVENSNNDARVLAMVELRCWCASEFGPMGGSQNPEPHERWCGLGTLILFRDPDDAFVFKMRWC
ncbi:MAG: hypothetical protein EOP84_07170 [Verrucomicrobiaceae bacterium]|nr:MAG: hypothetical protein EOP84_07170 [Verrucomicrobiaceae bacterium]